MKPPTDVAEAPLLRQVADTLRRARKAPRGAYRNDLRQLAGELRKLHRLNSRASANILEQTT
jgi:hypothetical protein